MGETDAGRVGVAPEREQLLYSVRDAAAMLGIGESTLRRHIEDGQIRAIRLVGRLLVPRHELERIADGAMLVPREVELR